MTNDDISKKAIDHAEVFYSQKIEKLTGGRDLEKEIMELYMKDLLETKS